MKLFGLTLMCFAAVGAWLWIYDLHEADRPIRLAGGLAAIILAPGGWLFFFEGLKREIIEELRKKP